jgi:hypothetical protein
MDREKHERSHVLTEVSGWGKIDKYLKHLKPFEKHFVFMELEKCADSEFPETRLETELESAVSTRLSHTLN